MASEKGQGKGQDAQRAGIGREPKQPDKVGGAVPAQVRGSWEQAAARGSSAPLPQAKRAEGTPQQRSRLSNHDGALSPRQAADKGVSVPQHSDWARETGQNGLGGEGTAEKAGGRGPVRSPPARLPEQALCRDAVCKAHSPHR